MVMYTVAVPEGMMVEIEALMVANPEAPRQKAAVIRDLLAAGLAVVARSPVPIGEHLVASKSDDSGAKAQKI